MGNETLTTLKFHLYLNFPVTTRINLAGADNSRQRTNQMTRGNEWPRRNATLLVLAVSRRKEKEKESSHANITVVTTLNLN